MGGKKEWDRGMGKFRSLCFTVEYAKVASFPFLVQIGHKKMRRKHPPLSLKDTGTV